jgi:ABC-type bacteriocin/lantibiotic exporter with double-glycine peptidase domain
MNARAVLFFILTCAVSIVPTITAQPSGVWLDVPFVAQTRDGCGSAAISMIMQYWEIQTGQAATHPADPEQIQSALYSRAAGGIPASKMREYFRAANYRVFVFQGSWNDLSHHLQVGRPLIVILKASGPLGPLHYVVVTGIDADRGYVYIHDPAQQKSLRMSREGFESEWNPTHHWTLLAVPQSGD